MFRAFVVFGRDFVNLLEVRSLRLCALLVVLLALPVIGGSPETMSGIGQFMLILFVAVVATYGIPMVVFVLSASVRQVHARQELKVFRASSDYERLRESFSHIHEIF